MSNDLAKINSEPKEIDFQIYFIEIGVECINIHSNNYIEIHTKSINKYVELILLGLFK